MSSNPAFGPNALGGSIALSAKKGLDYRNKEHLDSSIKIGLLLIMQKALNLEMETMILVFMLHWRRLVTAVGETIVKER